MKTNRADAEVGIEGVGLFVKTARNKLDVIRRQEWSAIEESSHPVPLVADEIQYRKKGPKSQVTGSGQKRVGEVRYEGHPCELK